MRFLTGIVLLAAAAQSGPGQAQERPEPPSYLAVGVGFNPDYVGSDAYRAIPFAAFGFSTPIADVRSSGLSVTADLLAPTQRDRRIRLELGPQVNYRFGRDDDIDDPAVLALGEIDDAVEAGLTAGISVDDVMTGGDGLSFRTEALRDVSGVYDGMTYGLEATYAFAVPRAWSLNVVANTQFGDDGFHDRYFDVGDAQSLASGLPAYDAETGFYQVAVGVNVRRSVSRRWFVAGQFVTARLIGDAADSPIVRLRGSETQLRGGVTVGVTF